LDFVNQMEVMPLDEALVSRKLIHQATTEIQYNHPVPRVAYYLQMSTVNIVLLICCVAYMSQNFVLLCLNHVNVHGDPVPVQIFHNIEFIGTFLFNVLNQFIIVYSPEKSHSPSITKALKWIALINVLLSSVSMMLVVIDLHVYEVPSHEAEYINNLLMAAFDVLILNGRQDMTDREKRWSVLSSIFVILVAIAQPCIYNGEGFKPQAEGGGPIGEKHAHYLEFSFELLSAFISARIIYENKMKADEILMEHVPFCMAQQEAISHPASRQHSADPEAPATHASHRC
jgi:hypothetical protein